MAETRELEPIVGGPCEGCEAVFQGMPGEIPSQARLAPAEEPGDPLVITGVVRDARGQPVPGIIIYAYHTDRGGIYPQGNGFDRGTAAYRHGRIRGWVRTDGQGHYEFSTIRPGGYPGADIPEHVHLHVIEPGRCTYYIDDIVFDDDPRLTARQRRQLLTGRGGNGLAVPVRDGRNGWRVTRDIVLGAGVPDYTPRH